MVHSHREIHKKNLNNFAILGAIVTQLMQSIGSENTLIILKISALYNIENYSKLKNHPLSKAYCGVVCVQGFVSTLGFISAFCDINST